MVLVARREDKLVELAASLDCPSDVIVCDLARPEAAAELEDELERRGIVVDVLVNNAGFGRQGEVLELALDEQLAMIQLNIATLVSLSRRLLTGMTHRGRGGVLNVASTAAFQPGPDMSVYFATKAFVLSFTEGLVEELKGSGVTVTALCPGATLTEFAEVADMEDSRLFTLFGMPRRTRRPRCSPRLPSRPGDRRSRLFESPGDLLRAAQSESAGRKVVRWLQ